MAKQKIRKDGKWEEIDLTPLKKDELLSLLEDVLPSFYKTFNKKIEFEKAFEDAQKVIKLREERIENLIKEVNIGTNTDAYKKQINDLVRENSRITNEANKRVEENIKLGNGIMKFNKVIDQMKLLMNQEYVALSNFIGDIQDEYIEKEVK